MGKFKINFRVVAALVVIVGVIFFTINAIQTEAYSGEALNITTSGVIQLTNTADVPAMLRASAGRAFTVTASGEVNETWRSVREGSGRETLHLVESQIAPGVTTLSVTRGSDVTFDLNAEATMDATVGARSDAGNRDLVVFAAVVCAAAIIYMSFATQHSWLKPLRSRLTNRSAREDITTSPA